MLEWSESFKDGYKDGRRYHMDFVFEVKDHDRYYGDDEYARGFDQAGDDS